MNDARKGVQPTLPISHPDAQPPEPPAPAATSLLTTHELALRHRKRDQTIRLERMRGGGVPYIRCGRKALYKIEDVLAFEEARKFTSTADETVKRGAASWE